MAALMAIDHFSGLVSLKRLVAMLRFSKDRSAEAGQHQQPPTTLAVIQMLQRPQLVLIYTCVSKNSTIFFKYKPPLKSFVSLKSFRELHFWYQNQLRGVLVGALSSYSRKFLLNFLINSLLQFWISFFGVGLIWFYLSSDLAKFMRQMILVQRGTL